MYYDLVASLPYLPHFERAERLPITQLRLTQRLRLLSPPHAEQLARAQSLVHWRPGKLLERTDADLVREYAAWLEVPAERALREYVALRMEQQTLLAALRRKRDGLDLPSAGVAWGVGPRTHDVRRRWNEPDFRLNQVYPWLARARELLAAGDAQELDRFLMDVAWRWLDRFAQPEMFRFEAVFAYFFKWDMLRAWLACDADKAATRFRDLIDKVIHVEHN
jgi:hypothetical protein